MSQEKIRKAYKNIFKSEGTYLSEEEMIKDILQYYAQKGKHFNNINEAIKYQEDEEHYIYNRFFN